MHLLEVGIATGREGAKQVERRRGLVVGADHPLRIRVAAAAVKFDAVDDIAAIAGQLDSILYFDIGRPRFGKLAGHASELHNRQFRCIGQHHRHLQDDAKRVADIVGMKFRKALGTITALQQECLAFRHLCQILFQAACFTGKDQRRVAAKQFLCFRKSGCVRILWHVQPFKIPPAICRPICRHQSAPLHFQ